MNFYWILTNFYHFSWFDKSEVSAAYIEGMNRRKGLLIPPPYAIANKLIKSWIQMTPNL